MQRGVRRAVAALELLAGAARTGIVAPRIRHLVELSQSFPRGRTGEPVGMDVPGRGSDPVNKRLMAGNAILVRLDQFLQPFPAVLCTVEVDDLEPVRPRVNEGLPTLRIERDALRNRNTTRQRLAPCFLRSCVNRNTAHSAAGRGST